ncbi:MAG TPA: hypothetical protein VFT45_14275 [Longimicrobium sp.]|nr:hypothetical protein [Longimicrobium sp.]
MREHEEVRQPGAVATAEREDSLDPGPTGGGGWLRERDEERPPPRAIEQMIELARDAKHGPPDYRFFLVVIAVLLFCAFVLWLFRPR